MVVAVENGDILRGLRAQVFLQLVALVQGVQPLDRLLQADRDQQANGDGAEVDPEALPRMRRLRHMDVDHGFVLLRSLREVCGLALKGRDFSPAISASKSPGL